MTDGESWGITLNSPVLGVSALRPLMTWGSDVHAILFSFELNCKFFSPSPNSCFVFSCLIVYLEISKISKKRIQGGCPEVLGHLIHPFAGHPPPPSQKKKGWPLLVFPSETLDPTFRTFRIKGWFIFSFFCGSYTPWSLFLMFHTAIHVSRMTDITSLNHFEHFELSYIINTTVIWVLHFLIKPWKNKCSFYRPSLCGN